MSNHHSFGGSMLKILKKWLSEQVFTSNKELHTVNPELISSIKQCVNSIDAICDLMPADDTSDDWRVYFTNIRQSLESMPNEHGLTKALQVWNSMQGGMGSWNDYYIPHSDQETMRSLNETLQKHCSTLYYQLRLYEQ